MKILTVIGTRPQFVKASVVSTALESLNFEETIVHTGQHFDKNMSSLFFKELNIPRPLINLGVNNLSNSLMISKTVELLIPIISKIKPHAVLVYGDSNSTVAGALAAKYQKLKLIHIESGLRSYRNDMPEELNRIITDRISDYLFCPTVHSYNNLQEEGFECLSKKIYTVGDVMYDAALHFSTIADESIDLFEKKYKLNKSEYILCTFHREENTSNWNKLIKISSAINTLSRVYHIVLPLHPRTQKALSENGISLDAEIIQPVGYLEMNVLCRNAKLILTDSGGLQKEAYFFNKYCILLRGETEWKELIEQKHTFLVNENKEKITSMVNKYYGRNYAGSKSIFGDGTAAMKIANHIKQDEAEFHTS